MTLVKLNPRTLGIVAILSFAPFGALVAQNVNNSDASSAGAAISAVSGLFTPGKTGTGGAVSFSAAAAITNSLAAGTLASPLTGNMVSAAVGAQISALLAGTPGTLATLQGQLNASGAPPAETAKLLLSLAGLTKNSRSGRSGDTDRAAVVTSLLAFNAMINASSPEFLGNAPPSIIAIHAVLSSLTEAGNIRP